MSGWDAYAALAGSGKATIFGKDGTPWGNFGGGIGAVRNFATLAADISGNKISSEMHFAGKKVETHSLSLTHAHAHAHAHAHINMLVTECSIGW